MKSDLPIIFLHEHPEYLEDCAILLSKQWKRSLSARYSLIIKSVWNVVNNRVISEIGVLDYNK